MEEVYKKSNREFRFNDLVVAEMIMASDEKSVGRLVQVRRI